MGAYQPYPIYDFKIGKVTSRDPWLLPQDAFETLRNAHIIDGVIEKRRGYEQYGEIVHTTTNATPPVDSNPGNAVMAVANYVKDDTKFLIALDTKRLNEYDTAAEAFVDKTRLKIHVKPGSNQDHAPVAGETIVGVSSGATAVIESIILDHGAWTDGDADAWIILTQAALGVVAHFTNGEDLEDTTGSTGHIHGIADGIEADYDFSLDPSGTPSDFVKFFWVENWDDVAYICNGHATDFIYRYQDDDVGTNHQLVPLYIDLDVEGGPDNDVLGVQLAFAFKGRLLLLSDVEQGTAYPRRARWSAIGDPGTWPANNFVDAPTDDKILGARFLSEELIVFFRESVWKLIYTGDSDLPFEWFRVSPTKGCAAAKSVIAVEDNLIMCMGLAGLVGSGSRQAFDMAPKIRRLPLSFNLDLVDYDYGLQRSEDLQVWITYSTPNATVPDSILVGTYTIDKGQFQWSWSTYGIPAHSLGLTRVQSDVILDTIEDVLDTIDYSFDDADRAVGYPITMIGSIDGFVYQANIGGTDDGAAIPLDILSANMNPYRDKGFEARFGWIDFLCDADDDISFLVSFYVDWGTSAHTSQTITLDGGQIGGKVWKRAFCNCVGQVHQFQITHTASDQRPRIHALIPYFQVAGKSVMT